MMHPPVWTRSTIPVDTLPIGLNEWEKREQRELLFVQDEVLSHSRLFSQQTPLLLVDVNEKVGKNKAFPRNNGIKMVCDDKPICHSICLPVQYI